MTYSDTLRSRRVGALAAVVLGVATLTAWSAPFHLHLLKSVPAKNTTVTAAPDSIRLWFSQAPELKLTTVKLSGPGTAAIELSPLAKGDSGLVAAGVKGEMAAGAYSVAWRTMSKDGHVVSGTFGFKVGAPAN